MKFSVLIFFKVEDGERDVVQIYRYIITLFILIGGFILMATSYYLGRNPKGLVVFGAGLAVVGGGLAYLWG
jgi:hypothetical protein